MPAAPQAVESLTTLSHRHPVCMKLCFVISLLDTAVCTDNMLVTFNTDSRA